MQMQERGWEEHGVSRGKIKNWAISILLASHTSVIATEEKIPQIYEHTRSSPIGGLVC